MERRPPGLWMKKELKETNYTLDGCSALVSVPCVVPVLSLSTMQTPACPGVPVCSHQNIMCSADCPEIVHHNLGQTLNVPSYTLLFPLMLFQP